MKWGTGMGMMAGGTEKGKAMLTSSLIALSVVLSAVAEPALFYVDPKGNDAWPGTEEQPFATIGRARDAVRDMVAKGLDRDVEVRIASGKYWLTEPLVFGPEFSHSSGHSIRFWSSHSRNSFISGGRIIKGWERQEDGTWTVTLDEVKSGAWRFRDLYRDGKRLTRGRYPNGTDLLRVESVSPDVKEIVLKEAPAAADLSVGDAKLVMYQNWSISRVRIVKAEGKTIDLANPMGWIGHGAATTASPEKPCYVENVREYVDQPGEWYLDCRTGVLTYMAEKDEDPNKEEFIAPVLDHLLMIEGTAEKPVRALDFGGFRFEHTNWALPGFGYLGIQAGHHGTTTQGPIYVLPAAIQLAHAEHCSLTNFSFVEHTGASGIALGAGCKNNEISCRLEDIGGNGIMVGWRGQDVTSGLVGDASLSADWKNPADVPKGNLVFGCRVSRCGAVLHGCVGIYDGFCEGTKIINNVVHDMPYTGMSVGFRWDESETSQRGTTIERNHVYDVMKMLADGGALYTLGYQPGTVIRGNHFHQVHRSAYAHGGAPNNGIFFDQGSKGYLVEDNVIYDTSGEPIRFNQTSKENLKWGKNYFGVGPESPQFPKKIVEKAGPLPQTSGISNLFGVIEEKKSSSGKKVEPKEGK